MNRMQLAAFMGMDPDDPALEQEFQVANAEFLVYETSTGAILRTISVPRRDAPLNAGAGEALLEISDVNTDYSRHYVSGGKIMKKAQLAITSPTVVVGDEVSFDLPEPAYVRVGTQAAYCEDPTLTLVFDTPGDYPLSLKMSRHYIEGVTIHVIERE